MHCLPPLPTLVDVYRNLPHLRDVANRAEAEAEAEWQSHSFNPSKDEDAAKLNIPKHY